MQRFKKITSPEQLHVGKFYVLTILGNRPVLVPFKIQDILDNVVQFTMTSMPEQGAFNFRINDLFKNHVFHVHRKDPILQDRTSTKNFEKYAAEGLCVS